MNNKINFIVIMVLLVGCVKKDVHLEEDLSPRFEKAMGYFNKGK